jgi:hypothetical protein
MKATVCARRNAVRFCWWSTGIGRTLPEAPRIDANLPPHMGSYRPNPAFVRCKRITAPGINRVAPTVTVRAQPQSP